MTRTIQNFTKQTFREWVSKSAALWKANISPLNINMARIY